MCPMVLTSHMGSRWHCQLFSKPGEELKESDGMLQRTAGCRAAEAKETFSPDLDLVPAATKAQPYLVYVLFTQQGFVISPAFQDRWKNHMHIMEKLVQEMRDKFLHEVVSKELQARIKMHVIQFIWGVNERNEMPYGELMSVTFVYHDELDPEHLVDEEGQHVGYLSKKASS